jgi:hypothetical protein
MNRILTALLILMAAGIVPDMAADPQDALIAEIEAGFATANARVKKQLLQADHCVAYAFPDSSGDHRIGEEIDRVDPAVLAARSVARKTLSSASLKAVLDAALDRAARYPVSECYDPHHLFVFYAQTGQPVGAIEVCLTCHRIRILPGEAETRNWEGVYETADLLALAEQLSAAGLPLTPFETLGEYRESLKEE